MPLFISQLPVSEEQKDALRKYERKYLGIYGGLIFLLAVAGRAANFNRFLLAGLLIALIAGLSIQLSRGSSRDLVTKVLIVLFVLFMALEYFLGIGTALDILFPLVGSVFLFASFRGRRDYVRSCISDSTN